MSLGSQTQIADSLWFRRFREMCPTLVAVGSANIKPGRTTVPKQLQSAWTLRCRLSRSARPKHRIASSLCGRRRVSPAAKGRILPELPQRVRAQKTQQRVNVGRLRNSPSPGRPTKASSSVSTTNPLLTCRGRQVGTSLKAG